MTDDWSLKGKVERPIASGVYYQSVILLLRQKLIEDFKEYCDGEQKILQDLIEILNKRFGVKE